MNVDNDKEYFWQYKDLKKRIAVILSDYRKNVDYYYSDLHSSNPEYFPIYNTAWVKYVELPDDPSDSGIAFYLGPSKTHNDLIEKVSLPNDFVQTYSNKSTQDLVRKIAEKSEIDLRGLYKEPVLMPHINQLSFYYDAGIGSSFASADAKKWNDDTEKLIAQVYPKRGFSLPASISAYRSLIDQIDDDEFRFEIKEAFDCYKNENYLACALVLCRALEWSCKLLLDKADSNIYTCLSTNNRTLNVLANKLEEQGLINSFEHSQLKAAIDYRNSIAHATPITQVKNCIQRIFDGIRLTSEKIINLHDD